MLTHESRPAGSATTPRAADHHVGAPVWRQTIRRGRSWWLALLFLILGGGVIGGLGQATHVTGELDQLPAGFGSTTVVQLSQQLPNDQASFAVVLFTADSGRLSGPALADLRSRYPGGSPGLQVSQDGTAAITVVPVTETGATAVADKVAQIRADAKRSSPPGVSSAVTGPAAVHADLAAVFDGADGTLLLATAGVVALLLLITYRSPVLWLVPLIVVGVADQLAATLATHALQLGGLSWDESTVGILSVLVFGAGTDYALLLISRYRDELRSTEDRYDAMRHALGTTAESILVSATTVVLGLLTLLLSLVPATRGLGAACAVGIAVAATFALVVLPTVLVLFGRWIFWPLVPRVGQPALVDSRRSTWRRVGDAVAARPTVFVVASVIVLAALATGTLQIRSGLSEAEQFLDKPEAISAGQRLAESFPAGESDPTVVLTRADPQSVTRTLAAVPGVASARPTLSAGGLTKVEVVLDAAAGSAQARGLVGELRDAVASYPETFVGGSEAQAVDATSAATRDRLVIIPLILVLVLLSLGLLLRSIAAPIILVASVVATYFAALGASWWLFTEALGFERLDSGVPLLAFLFLVALGVDYNIFLVSRAAQEGREHGPREGMLRALTATGGVITSAGILLAAVFAVLGVLPLVVLAQLGVVIFVGVLLDTLLVRTVVVPAIALALGDRFWWPRRIGAAR